MSTGPNTVDMTSVGSAKSWIPGFQNNPAPDDAIQRLVTGVSREVVRICGAKIDFQPGSPTYGASSLNSQIVYTEIYDGNGSDVLPLDNRPIHQVISLFVNGYAPPVNVPYGTYGVFIERARWSLAWMTGSGRGSSNTTVGWQSGVSGRFPMGRGNIQVTYLAGYGEPNGGSPPEFTTPSDLEVAVLQTIALNYTRRDRIGLVSENIQGTAATTYAKYEIPPEAALVFRMYTRVPLGAQA